MLDICVWPISEHVSGVVSDMPFLLKQGDLIMEFDVHISLGRKRLNDKFGDHRIMLEDGRIVICSWHVLQRHSRPL